MPELTWTFDTPSGPVTMPYVQAMKIAECLKALEDEGLQPTWHPNECGCCYSVHENTVVPEGGWVVGPDGGADWNANHRHN